MTQHVEFVEPTQSLREAAQLMRQLDVGPMPVCEEGRVVGILTDRDITIRAVADGRDPDATPVAEVMSRNVAYCHPEDEVEKAAELMASRQLRRLLVLDAERRLSGIVSIGDLATRKHDPKLVGKVIEDVSQPGNTPTSRDRTR
jgi:CBS domain-containing protein